MDNQTYQDMLRHGCITVKRVVTSQGAQMLRDMLTTRPYLVDIKWEFELVTTDRYYAGIFARACIPDDGKICRENIQN